IELQVLTKPDAIFEPVAIEPLNAFCTERPFHLIVEVDPKAPHRLHQMPFTAVAMTDLCHRRISPTDGRIVSLLPSPTQCILGYNSAQFRPVFPRAAPTSRTRWRAPRIPKNGRCVRPAPAARA